MCAVMGKFLRYIIKLKNKPHIKKKQLRHRADWYDPICVFKKLYIHIKISAYLCKKYMESYTLKDRDRR